jgi:protease-4
MTLRLPRPTPRSSWTLRRIGLPAGGRLLLELDLTRGLLEAPPSSPIAAMRSLRTPSLRAVVEALDKAAREERVAGLVAHVGIREPSLAQSNELRTVVRAFRAAGKPTVCWSESYGETGPGNVAYHFASAFEEVWLQPSGDLGLVGLTGQAVFVREMLDQLSIQTQLGQRHEYKTAANMFLESGMTDAQREMTTALVESAMATIVADVAEARGMTAEAVRDVVDRAPLSAAEAVAAGLVDRVGYRDDVYASLRERLGEVELLYAERFGRTGIGQLAGSTPLQRKPVVALVQASGPIHLGRSGSSPLAGTSVGSDSLSAALRAAARDDEVQAVVLRVDSPGGSYVASDAIRREVLALRRAGKPVIASMATVAASGGYYIAMPCDRIVANPGTLTGSIGVLAGKQVIRDALARIGVRVESVSSGRYAEMFSPQRPFGEDEWQRLEAWLDRVYDDFTSKAAEDRGMEVEALRAVAKGRVWTGADAQRRGLVDDLGGLAEAIDAACRAAGVDRSDVRLRVLPKVKPLERLMPAENSEAPAAAAGLGFGLDLGDGVPLLDLVSSAIGMPGAGVLTAVLPHRLQ